jgi:hypothetical protein
MCFCTDPDYRSCNPVKFVEVCHLDVNYFSADVFISTDLIQNSDALRIGFCWLTARTKRDEGFLLSRRIKPGQSKQSHLKSNFECSLQFLCLEYKDFSHTSRIHNNLKCALTISFTTTIHMNLVQI